MKHSILSILSSAVLVAASAQVFAQTPPTGVERGMPPARGNDDIVRPAEKIGNPTDVDVMRTLAVGGMAEVEASQLAGQKASNGEVRKFAQQMVEDHSKVNEKLKALATDRHVGLPAELDAQHQADKSKLNTLSGRAFDAEYMKVQVTNHEKTVRLLQHQIQNGQDAKVKAFAQEILPTVRHHLEMAQALQEKSQQKSGQRKPESNDRTAEVLN